jgi:hypothetical protein
MKLPVASPDLETLSFSVEVFELSCLLLPLLFRWRLSLLESGGVCELSGGSYSNVVS